MLQGVVGTGKTALLEEFGGRAREAGALLLRASGAPTESSLSLGIVRQLLAGEVFDREGAATVRGLLDHRLLADAACDGVSRSRVLDGLATAVLELAGQSTVVIAIDDTQYLDAFSQDWLIYLLRRAGHARLLIVFGWRDDDIEMSADNSRLLCAELYQQAYLRRLLLAPLSSGGVAQLMTGRLSESGPAEPAAQAHRLTGGNLLLLHALLEDSRAAAGGDGPPAELSTGPEFERAVQVVLGRCDPVTLRVAGAISVIGEASRFAYLDRLVGLPSDRVAAAVQVLTRTGLVEAGRMRHPVMAGVVLSTFSAADRLELSRRAADLLKACGADSLTIAEHFVASGRLDDPSAVLNLVEGAKQALKEGHARRATELLRLAYQVDTGRPAPGGDPGPAAAGGVAGRPASLRRTPARADRSDAQRPAPGPAHDTARDHAAAPGPGGGRLRRALPAGGRHTAGLRALVGVRDGTDVAGPTCIPAFSGAWPARAGRTAHRSRLRAPSGIGCSNTSGAPTIRGRPRNGWARPTRRCGSSR
ncbi:hypothetical protein TPA0905_46930 [Streptomyces olivaceus]|nr:hypothetical protein TPA0905_46930 [Streptomyces olivaceus]